MAGDYVISGRVVEAGLTELHDLMERVGAEHDDVDPALLLMLETALIEVAGNAVEHGTPPGGLRYRFVLEVDPDGLRGTFSDDGDPVALPSDAPMPDDPLAEGGRGLALARATLSELRYERRDERNVWTLVRRRTGPVTEVTEPVRGAAR